MACTAILRATAAAFRNCLSIDIETARAERSGAVLCSTGFPQRHAPDCERYGGMGKAGNSDNVLHVAESEVRPQGRSQNLNIGGPCKLSETNVK